MVTPDESALQRPPPRWPQAARPPTAQDADVARSGLTRLLVVDDDLGSIEYLGQLLKGCAQISFATNGEDALRLAACGQRGGGLWRALSSGVTMCPPWGLVASGRRGGPAHRPGGR